MARDYTKYNVEGLGENLSKRKLVFTIVKDWVEKNNPSFEELQTTFPDEIHGGNPDKFGLVRKEADVKNHRYFNMREPLKIKQGVHVVVMNQWGDNIEDFIAASEKLGYQINKSEKPTSSFEVTGSEAVKKEYLNYFRDQKFEDVIDFIKVTNQLFKSFCWESESDCEEVADLYNKLSEITSTDCPRYGGYLYLFTQISSDMGEGEYDTYFDWDIALEYGYSWHYITSNNQTVVHMVANEYEQNKFNIYFASLFVMTLLRSVDDAQSEDIAEFIVANDIHDYGEAFKDVDVTKMEDYIGDFVIAILKAMNYDINDYEGDCLIEGRHFLDMDLEMGYNYLKLAEDFRDSNV